MPLVQLKEVYTPLRLFRIKLFKCKQDGKMYIKKGKKPVKRMFA
ncbi:MULTISPECIES: hypothetical protein [Metabacillus]|nr:MULTISPECIES: hypothetical protein [Metabacillus]